MAMLVCLAIAMFSCSKDDEELGVEAGIVGEWEVVSNEQLINGKDALTFIEEFAEQTDQSVEDLKERFDYEEDDTEGVGAIIVFNSDNTFEEKDDDTSKGTWRAGEDRTLIMQYKDEFVEYEITYGVKSLNSDNASLSLAYDETTEDLDGNEYELTFEYVARIERK